MPDPFLACTLAGGPDARRERLDAWRAVIGRAAGREPVESGIALRYDHDTALAVELARLAAAEVSCCSFFTFSLTIGAPGMRLVATAPAGGQDAIAELLGAAA